MSRAGIRTEQPWGRSRHEGGAGMSEAAEAAGGAAEGLLQRATVRRVAEALAAAGAAGRVRALAETARTAQDAASALGCPVGAIVKSLVFACADRPVMALVAGDRQCDTKALGEVLAERFGLAGKVSRADADLVRRATGFAIGGVAPLGHAEPMPVVMDASLRRFDTVWAAAGHPHCVFDCSPAELVALAGAVESDRLARA